jgi:hypothetical protein
LLLGLDWFVVVGHKWNDYRNVIPEVYPKLFGASLARNIHGLVQFALSYKSRSTAHWFYLLSAACGPQIAIVRIVKESSGTSKQGGLVIFRY